MSCRDDATGRWREELKALRAADAVLGRLIDREPDRDPWAELQRWPHRPFALLVRTIVGQQISTPSANAIYERLELALDGDLSAAAVMARTDQELLQVGLSHAKVRSLRSLSANALFADLTCDRVEDLADAELRDCLMSVRGVGPWTTELFLIALGREDALPAADVGLRRAIRSVYGLDHLPTAREVQTLAERWRPRRSVATLLLYRSLEGNATQL